MVLLTDSYIFDSKTDVTHYKVYVEKKKSNFLCLPPTSLKNEWCMVWKCIVRISEPLDSGSSLCLIGIVGSENRSVQENWVLGFEFWVKVGHFGFWILSSKV